MKGERSKVKGQGSKLKGERNSNRRIGLEFYCLTPGLEEEPVVLTVKYDGRILDEVVFGGKGQRSKVKGER